MEALIQPRVQEPRADTMQHGVSARVHQYTGSDHCFELMHTGMWEFIHPLHDLAVLMSEEPPEGGVRTWRVDPIHPGGEWLAEVTEIRCVVGGNGTIDVGPVGHVEMNAVSHLEGMTRKGAKVILHGRDPRMGPYRNFRANHYYDDGRAFWTFAGVGLRLDPMGGAAPELDRGWLVGLRRQIVSAGIAPKMTRGRLDWHLSVYRNRLQGWLRLLNAGKLESATYERLVAEARATMTAMTAAFDRQFGDGAGARLNTAHAASDGGDPLGLDAAGYTPPTSGEPEADPEPPKRGRR